MIWSIKTTTYKLLTFLASKWLEGKRPTYIYTDNHSRHRFHCGRHRRISFIRWTFRCDWLEKTSPILQRIGLYPQSEVVRHARRALGSRTFWKLLHHWRELLFTRRGYSPSTPPSFALRLLWHAGNTWGVFLLTLSSGLIIIWPGVSDDL